MIQFALPAIILRTTPIEQQNVEMPTFDTLIGPIEPIVDSIPPIESGCNREITFTFKHQLNCLIYYHLEEYTSALSLLQAIERDDAIEATLVPEKGMGRSTFYEANATRGVEQMYQVFSCLSKKLRKKLKVDFSSLGELIAIDGSLIDASLSMTWADYRTSSNKAKVHLGLDLNTNLPSKLHLTPGKAAERPFADLILEPGQTGVVDRGYQDHDLFDSWIDSQRHFVARLKNNTRWHKLEELPFESDKKIFFFGKVLVGDSNHRMRHPVYLVGFRVRSKTYWIATSRSDLSAQQIAFIYLLRWRIETLFSWWKKHLKVYHLISRSPHGVLLQMLAGLVTYQLFLLYCQRTYNTDKPSIERLRQLRADIRNDAKSTTVNLFIHIQPIILFFSFDTHASF